MQHRRGGLFQWVVLSHPFSQRSRFLAQTRRIAASGDENALFPAPFSAINILELLTIMVTLNLWGELLRAQRVILQCDNENSVLAINSGRCRLPGMHLCLREIWFLTARYDIDIFARHVAGVDNSIADHLSRWHLSPGHHTRFAALTADTPTEHVPCSPLIVVSIRD